MEEYIYSTAADIPPQVGIWSIGRSRRGEVIYSSIISYTHTYIRTIMLSCRQGVCMSYDWSSVQGRYIHCTYVNRQASTNQVYTRYTGAGTVDRRPRSKGIWSPAHFPLLSLLFFSSSPSLLSFSLFSVSVYLSIYLAHTIILSIAVYH